MKILYLSHLIYILFLNIDLRAQGSSEQIESFRIADEYILEHLDDWGLTLQDISGKLISDFYIDKLSGISRIYFQQSYEGIPVHNAILNINITRQGQVYFSGNRFVPHLAEKVNVLVPVIRANEAISNLCAQSDLNYEELRLKSQTGESKFIFEKGLIAKEDITVDLVYQSYDDNIHLAWDILFSPVGNYDKWSARVDAVTGNVLEKNNWTFYCNADVKYADEESHIVQEYPDCITPELNSSITVPQYNVWPAPIENPMQGPRTMVTDPVDTLASPFGWHDTDGVAGAEYTITRGNNAHVFQDRDNLGYSSDDEPDGGPQLNFDFPFDPSWEPEQYIDAAAVNLFYWINYMHDFAYHFGFDEAAGNFQVNNYGKGGVGNDGLFGIVQNGATEGYKNNAIYSHRNEGESAGIRMMVFKDLIRFLDVNEPENASGKYETYLPGPGWGKGAYVTEEPVTGEVVMVDDGVEEPLSTDGCEDFINADALVGKIALMDRGGCQFGYKALKAQNAGAIAIIICNINDNPAQMAAGPEAPQIKIPIVLIKATDGQKIKQFAENGLIATLVDPGQDGTVALDSDLDNDIIAHEFGHGIACRIAGGPNRMCLLNAEQMQEGWADFFSLAITAQPGDSGEKKRGFGTYVLEESPSGKGLRRYPYSTDLNIMPLTYGDVAPNQEFHDLGEVWGSTLWDMYWALVDKYGWSANHYDESSGNYKAIRLVIDGLKNLVCNPGFVDGRNAILAADEVLYHSENHCLIWEVFARRGIGYSADQGSSFDAGDQKEAFDLPNDCTNKITVEKAVTDFIQPGDDIEVTIKVGNYKSEKATHVEVVDEIPEGTTFEPHPSTLPAIIHGNTVKFTIGDLNPKEEVIITYKLESNPDAWSKRKFLDEVSNPENENWLVYTIGNAESNHWMITNQYSADSGNYAWVSHEIPEKSRQVLELNPDVYFFHVDGDHPVLRFYHRFDTKAGLNGGVVDVRELGATTWNKVGDHMLRNGYTGIIDYHTFHSPNIEAFSGSSGNEMEASYVDLSSWADKDIQIRFRFGTDTTTNNGTGWIIDDIEFMDLLTYNAQVCVSSQEGDFECATAPESGTIVDSKDELTSVIMSGEELNVKIYPNPANDIITIAWTGDHQKDVNVTLLTINGKQIYTRTQSHYGNERLTINTENISPGLYLIKVVSEESQSVSKVIIQE